MDYGDEWLAQQIPTGGPGLRDPLTGGLIVEPAPPPPPSPPAAAEFSPYDANPLFYQELARNLPGAQGWHARSSQQLAENIGRMLATEGGQIALQQAAADNPGLGFVSDIVESPYFATAVKAGIAKAGGPVGALGVTALAVTSDDRPDLFTREQIFALAAPEPEPAPPPTTESTMNGESSSFWPDLSSWNWGTMFETGLGALNNLLAIKAAARTPPAVAVAAPQQLAPLPVPGLPQIAGALDLGGLMGRIAGGVGSVVGGAVRATAGLVRTVAGKIRGVMVNGRFVSRSKAVALAKRIGLDAAAVALGITTVELAQMVLESSGSGRRMNPLNIKAARRAIRRIRSVRNVTASIERDVARSLPPRRMRSFSRGSPGVITRREARRALRR